MANEESTITVLAPDREETVIWNGSNRERAVELFDQYTEMGYLATVTEGPGRRRQVRSFTEIDELEKTGTVEVLLSQPLVGG